MSIALHFLGAARRVTGSKHLLEVGEHRILFDCGMVQGPRRLATRLNRDLPLDPHDVSAVVLTHAHIDHSGSLPRLVKLGYRGPIHCTWPTADLAGILLRDSAEIQAQDARHLAKRGHVFEPPYDLDDVETTLRQLAGHRYHEPFEVVPGVHVELYDAGHILGSAMAVVDVKIRGQHVRIAFSGDHGRKGMPILRDPEPLPDVDYLVTESTYGDRLHGDRRATLDEIAALIHEEERDGGRMLIPAFSVGRTQNLLYDLSRMSYKGLIPDTPIWIDSPMSTRATAATVAHPEVYDKQTRALIEKGQNPFVFEGVRYTRSVEESIALNSQRHGIIISASGMCEAGRILHHLRETLPRKEDCVVIVGYMAEGTLGRKLVSGYEYVKIFGERYAVRCKVRSLPGMSAHADYQEMLDSYRHLVDAVRCVFVVHGEEDPAQKFADRLLDTGFRRVEVPLYKERFEL